MPLKWQDRLGSIFGFIKRWWKWVLAVVIMLIIIGAAL